MKAVIPIGAPIKVFETAVTTILRTLESYDVDKLVLLYPPFATSYLKDIISFLRILKTQPKIEIKEINYRMPLEEEVKDSDLIVPSATSVVYVIKLTTEAVKNSIPIDHVMFPFGPWYGLFYPYVPRFLVPMFKGKEDVNDIINYDYAKDSINSLLKNRELSKIIASLSLDFNVKEKDNYRVGEDITLCIDRKYEIRIKNEEEDCLLVLDKGKITFNGKEVEPEELVKKLFNDNSGTLDKELGFYSIKVVLDREYELRELMRKYRGILIDTNLIYRGIVFYPDIQTLLPYCAYIEIANNRSKPKRNKAEIISHELAWIYLQELISRSTMIPTPIFFCDAIIPMIDPLLIKDSLILSSDKATITHWKNVISNAEIGELKCEKKRDFNELSFSLILLSWILKNYLK
ncbi:hypothetical protein SJAV_08650 [Sulfurisphaera javensis]|uniref:Uncharacterized protein n=1 Tax=Sulfurisphaera javensis TaxID=2049879 RepID=A0AAT9GQK9_9CREN